MLAVLAAWALRQGCPRLYLQVLADDAAPLALYRRGGFTEAFGYHYRGATPPARALDLRPWSARQRAGT